MNLKFSIADPADAPALAALHSAVNEDLNRRFDSGPRYPQSTERGVLAQMRIARIVIARSKGRIVGTLNLQNKKPWAIDVSYFTPVGKAIYLTGMAVAPTMQRKGIGRLLLDEAARQARAWPANAIRLDAFDHASGAGGFYAKCGYTNRGHATYRNAPLIYFELMV